MPTWTFLFLLYFYKAQQTLRGRQKSLIIIFILSQLIKNMQKSLKMQIGYTIHKNPTFGEPFFKVFYDMLQSHLNINITVATSESFLLFIYPLFSPSDFFSFTPQIQVIILGRHFRSRWYSQLFFAGVDCQCWCCWVWFWWYHGLGGLSVHVVATVIIENNIMNIFYIIILITLSYLYINFNGKE